MRPAERGALSVVWEAVAALAAARLAAEDAADHVDGDALRHVAHAPGPLGGEGGHAGSDAAEHGRADVALRWRGAGEGITLYLCRRSIQIDKICVWV